MKRTCLYFVFFMLVYSVQAQQKKGEFIIPLATSIDSTNLANEFQKKGNAIGSKDTSAALRLLNRAAAIFKVRHNFLEEGRCYRALGDIFFEAGNYNRSFNNYSKAADALFEVNLSESYRAALGIAKTQYHRSLYRFAIKSLSEVIEFAIKNNDYELRAACGEYLGLIYSIWQSSSESKTYFTDAFSTFEKMKNEKGCLRISEKLFELNYADHVFDSALYYSNISLKIAESLKQEESFQLSKLNRISALIRLERFTEAKKELDEFASIAIPGSDMNMRLRFQVANGNYYMALKDNQQGILYYNTAIKLASTTNTPDQLAMVYNHMSEAFSAQGEYKSAYEYARKYHEMMNDFYSNSIKHLSRVEGLMNQDVSRNEIKYLNKINDLKEIKLLRELELRYSLQQESILKDSLLKKEKLLSQVLERENSSKTQQLTNQLQLSNTLDRESQMQKKKLGEERMVRILLTAGLFALLGLGGITLYQYRRAKIKKEIIQKQADELQTLMKEIHHRVKNNLQIISSLLDIQSMSLSDTQASEAIKEGRNRVQSMAIIHQHLYQEGNIRSIHMGDYINNLAQNLFSSYNIDPEKISLETAIDKIHLDVDTVIPLGLIINELLSNSLKYAFTDAPNGKLMITLQVKGDNLDLFVKDNGKGFPVGMNVHNDQTFGLQLITALAQKLKATLDFYNDNGAIVYIQIKKFKLA